MDGRCVRQPGDRVIAPHWRGGEGRLCRSGTPCTIPSPNLAAATTLLIWAGPTFRDTGGSPGITRMMGTSATTLTRRAKMIGLMMTTNLRMVTIGTMGTCPPSLCCLIISRSLIFTTNIFSHFDPVRVIIIALIIYFILEYNGYPILLCIIKEFGH